MYYLCICNTCLDVVISQIEIRGVNYTGVVTSSDQDQVSVLVSQLNQNFTKGENHTVMVFATNSVGTSSPLSTLLIVPGELPNTTCIKQQVLAFN